MEIKKINEQLKNLLNEKYCTKAEINKFLRSHKATEVSFGRYTSEVKRTEKLYDMYAYGSKKVAGTYDYFELKVYSKGAVYTEQLANNYGKSTTKYYVFGKEAENITESEEDNSYYQIWLYHDKDDENEEPECIDTEDEKEDAVYRAKYEYEHSDLDENTRVEVTWLGNGELIWYIDKDNENGTYV